MFDAQLAGIDCVSSPCNRCNMIEIHCFPEAYDQDDRYPCKHNILC